MSQPTHLRYSLRREEFLALLTDQEDACAICRKPFQHITGAGFSQPGLRSDIHIDHDHACCPGRTSCGRCVRGLLCRSCNTGLAAIEDDSFQRAALAYLRRGRGWAKLGA